MTKTVFKTTQTKAERLFERVESSTLRCFEEENQIMAMVRKLKVKMTFSSRQTLKTRVILPAGTGHCGPNWCVLSRDICKTESDEWRVTPGVQTLKHHGLLVVVLGTRKKRTQVYATCSVKSIFGLIGAEAEQTKRQRGILPTPCSSPDPSVQLARTSYHLPRQFFYFNFNFSPNSLNFILSVSVCILGKKVCV